MASTTLDGPRLEPASGDKPDRLVVFVHGYGADGRDLIGLGLQWREDMPTTAFVSPNAPEKCGMSPFGFQWFPIERHDPALYLQGVLTAAPILNDFLDAELERWGLPDEALSLVGFSQGTMMSLHVGLRRKTPPKAIVGYSGALIGSEKLGEEIVSRPPVLLVHGDMDDLVTVDRMHSAVESLGKNDIKVIWHVSHGVGHGIAPDGLELGGKFLNDAYAGNLKA